VKRPRGILVGLGDFLEYQMKHSTHYSFAKSPGGNLGGPGDFLKSKMKYKRIVVL
jgi:hypothetical protein